MGPNITPIYHGGNGGNWGATLPVPLPPQTFHGAGGGMHIQPISLPPTHDIYPPAFRSPIYDYPRQPSVPPYPAQPSLSTGLSDGLQLEMQQLRRKVRELEAECARSRTELESVRRSSSNAGGLPTPPQSSSFRQSWRARTDARKRIFCSLNRAGNALCAWHDSRRERRAFPPRNAPNGYLNCSCTHEEALFEESLARHGVGSYYPGESVRMDPALRNPLFKLLQKRYGYQDGDFERDITTGEWLEGEGHAYWEQQAHSSSGTRRLRVDAERQ